MSKKRNDNKTFLAITWHTHWSLECKTCYCLFHFWKSISFSFEDNEFHWDNHKEIPTTHKKLRTKTSKPKNNQQSQHYVSISILTLTNTILSKLIFLPILKHFGQKSVVLFIFHYLCFDSKYEIMKQGPYSNILSVTKWQPSLHYP